MSTTVSVGTSTTDITFVLQERIRELESEVSSLKKKLSMKKPLSVIQSTPPMKTMGKREIKKRQMVGELKLLGIEANVTESTADLRKKLQSVKNTPQRISRNQILKFSNKKHDDIRL